MSNYKYVEVRGRGKFIDKHGNAYNPIRKNQKATIHINPDGYPCFGGGVPVHLYVAHAWVPGYFPGAEVDHIDSDRTNYDSSNLRWVSHKDNVEHATQVGNMSKYGEKNSRSVETYDTVCKIRYLFEDGYSVADIIKMLRPDINRNVDLNEYKRVHKRYSRMVKNETW